MDSVAIHTAWRLWVDSVIETVHEQGDRGVDLDRGPAGGRRGRRGGGIVGHTGLTLHDSHSVALVEPPLAREARIVEDSARRPLTVYCDVEGALRASGAVCIPAVAATGTTLSSAGMQVALLALAVGGACWTGRPSRGLAPARVGIGRGDHSDTRCERPPEDLKREKYGVGRPAATPIDSRP